MESHFLKLKEKGYKITPRRRAIIELFVSAGTHLTAEDVWGKIRKKIKRCGLPGIYRNLEELTECGILTRIQLFDRRKHYSICSAPRAEHHHHITCLKCGKVGEIENCAIDDSRNINGYKVVSHFVQINGICPVCLKKNKKRD